MTGFLWAAVWVGVLLLGLAWATNVKRREQAAKAQRPKWWEYEP